MIKEQDIEAQAIMMQNSVHLLGTPSTHDGEFSDYCYLACGVVYFGVFCLCVVYPSRKVVSFLS